MFETLEPAERPAEPRWLFLMSYSAFGLVGLVFGTLSVRKHGLAQPTHLVLACAMCFLSLMWLAATLRSRTPLSSRKAGFRNVTLMLLFLAINTLSR